MYFIMIYLCIIMGTCMLYACHYIFWLSPHTESYILTIILNIQCMA